MMLAAGTLRDFACGYGHLAIGDGDRAVLDADAAALLGVGVGDSLLAVGR